MNKNKTFLWLIPKWTLPATDGARVATDRLIKNMVKAGAVIDVICLGNPGENIDIEHMKKSWRVRNIFYKSRPIPQSKFAKILFYFFKIFTQPTCPLTMSSFNSYTVKEFINNIASKKKYDYLFLDGLHLGSVFMEKGHFTKPNYVDQVVYRAHNLETEIWEKAAKDTPHIIKRLLLNIQCNLIKKYEREIISGSHLIAPISEEDNTSIKELVPGSNTHLTLMGMDFKHPLEYQQTEKTHFLFLGRLDWPPNKDGLKWLLDNVWPYIDTKQYHLDVAGSGNRQWLSRYNHLEGVSLHGFVDDINDLYALSSASLIPIFYGSGTRIKVVETYTKGRSMISTTMGAQGSSLRAKVDFTVAESASDWITAINNFELEQSKTQAICGAKRLMTDFDEVKVAEGLYQRLL